MQDILVEIRFDKNLKPQQKLELLDKLKSCWHRWQLPPQYEAIKQTQLKNIESVTGRLRTIGNKQPPARHISEERLYNACLWKLFLTHNDDLPEKMSDSDFKIARAQIMLVATDENSVSGKLKIKPKFKKMMKPNEINRYLQLGRF